MQISPAAYAFKYIKQLFAGTITTPPDPSLAATHLDLLQTVYDYYAQDKKANAREFWQAKYPDFPDLVEMSHRIKAHRLYTIAGLAELPRLEYLIPCEIPAQSLVALYGPSGSGKTFVALDYALQIAKT